MPALHRRRDAPAARQEAGRGRPERVAAAVPGSDRRFSYGTERIVARHSRRAINAAPGDRVQPKAAQGRSPALPGVAPHLYSWMRNQALLAIDNQPLGYDQCVRGAVFRLCHRGEQNCIRITLRKRIASLEQRADSIPSCDGDSVGQPVRAFWPRRFPSVRTGAIAAKGRRQGFSTRTLPVSPSGPSDCSRHCRISEVDLLTARKSGERVGTGQFAYPFRGPARARARPLKGGRLARG